MLCVPSTWNLIPAPTSLNLNPRVDVISKYSLLVLGPLNESKYKCPPFNAVSPCIASATTNEPNEPVEVDEPLTSPSTKTLNLSPAPVFLNVSVLLESELAWNTPFPSSFCIVKVAVPVLLYNTIVPSAVLAWPKYKTPVNLPELATSKPKPGSFTPIPNPVESPVNVGLPFIVNEVIVSVIKYD